MQVPPMRVCPVLMPARAFFVFGHTENAKFTGEYVIVLMPARAFFVFGLFLRRRGTMTTNKF